MGKKPSYKELEKRIKQLEKAEAERNLMFELSPDLVGTANLVKGYFTRVNHAWEIFGRPLNEFIERPFLDFVHPDDQKKTIDKVNVMQSGQTVFGFENRYRCKDGSYKIIEWRASSSQPDGTAYVSGRDITKRKLSEDALKKSEEKYRSLFERMNEGFAVHEIILDEHGQPCDFKFLEMNPACERQTGLKAREMIGRCVREIATESVWIKRYGRVALTGEPEHFVEFSKVLDRWFEVSAFQPEPGQCAAIFTDITERIQIEMALKNSESQLRTLIRTIPDLVWFKDPQGVYLSCNDRFEKLFGAAEKDIIGKTDYDFVSKQLADFFRKNDKIAIAKGKPSINEEEVTFAADGHREILETVKTPIYKEDGQLFGVLGIGRDITERIRLQEQLIQAQKMESIGRLAGGVAHDYNNMLSIIIGYTELSLEKVQKGDALYDDLLEVLSAAKRSTDITRQLLAFARRQTIAPKVLDLNDTIESLLKMLQRLIGEDIDLAWLPDADLWPVMLDPSQIDQMLVNLCVNARDAIAGVGKITIETGNARFDETYCSDHKGFLPGDYVMFAISDDGRGMEPKTLNKVFEPFFTTKRLGKGTGLGLATVYGIVKQNNGFINVYTEPQKGTTFKIYLSRHTGQAVGLSSDRLPKTPFGQGEIVLLVEDDDAILKLGKRILEDMGYRVLTAATPNDALALAKTHSSDIRLLITDVVMPEMNGRELSEKLKRLYPDLKVLFMSGYTANVIAHRGVLDEGVFFISKPFSKKDMGLKIRKVLDEGEHSSSR